MTLPFSDKPEKSSIYQDVKTETLQELTPEQFDAFRARMFAEGVNGLEDEYRRLLLLGLASDKISTSGHIPGTGRFEYITQTVGGTPAEFFIPDPGEVWQIGGLSYVVDGGSGSIVYQVVINDGAGSNNVLISEKQSSDNADNFGDVDYLPVSLDENTQLKVTAFGTFTSVEYRLYCYRIR